MDPEPIINLDDPIGKTVGRRTLRDPFTYAMGLQRTAVQLQRAFGGPRFPCGVFRFRSFEEADEWTMKYLIQTRPR